MFSSPPDPEPDSGTGNPDPKVTTKLTSKGSAKTESIGTAEKELRVEGRAGGI
jgi:hypothetical protein